jgi:HEAT repeat protein
MSQFFAFVLMSALLLQDPSLDGASPKEREAAVEQMAVLGNRDAIPVLAGALKKEPRTDLRVQIVAALGRIGDKAAVPVLAETLRTDLARDVRLQSIGSLLRLYIPMDDAGPLRSIFNRVKSVFFVPNRPVVSPEVQVDAAAKEALTQALQKDFNDDVRIEAARALGSLKAKDQVAALAQTLDDPLSREHEPVRMEIVMTLGTIRNPSAGPALEKALRDPNKRLVGEAILSLGLVGYAQARGTIENMFRTDSDRRIKNRSIEALSLMHDPGSTPLFESLLGHADNYYREMAAEGLARLDYDASGFKERYAQERNQNVRNALAFGLASSGQDEYINDLANALDSRQDYQVEIYLYELGKFDRKLNELHRYLRSSNPVVRARMARVLGNIGDPASTEPLRALTNDSDVEVVREAVAALRKMNLPVGAGL